jgi:hypothetical protein
LEIRLKVFGEKHLDVAESYNNIAANLESQGKDTDAQDQYEKARGIYRVVRGEDHPDTARVYNGIGVILFAQGKHTEARSLLPVLCAISLC